LLQNIKTKLFTFGGTFKYNIVEFMVKSVF